MATGRVQIDEGSTTNLATNTFTEDAVTKHVNRSVLNTSAGVEIGTSGAPIQVSLANTATNSTAVKVDGSAATQPVSAATLPLPTGAATSAKQPALGTAGSASSDVITIQGAASMTKLLVTPDLPTGAATATNQTGGSQKTQIVDGSGNVIGATSNALDINVKSGSVITTYADTAPATQNITVVDSGSSSTTGANSQPIITGSPTANSSASFSLSSIESVVLQVTGTWTGTLQSEISFDGGTNWYVRGIHQVGITYTVSITTSNLSGIANVTGATNYRLRATAAMTGTAAVKVIESLNTTSVYLANSAQISDGTIPSQKLAVNASGQISESNLPATVDTNSGNKSASTVRVVLATDQPVLTNKLLVTPDSVALPANQSVNVSQINAVTPLMGNGVTGTGSQRVTIASDNTAFSVNATLTAETTKAIGVVRSADGSGNLLTSTSNALDVNLKTSAASNISTNIAQLAGNTISSGVGATGTGTLRVVEANDVGRTLKSAGGSASSSGNNTLVAAGTNKLKVFAFSLTTTSTTAVTCIFQSGASGTELWRVVLQAPTSVNVGANLAVTAPAYLFNTAAATLLNLNLSGAQTVHWSVGYFDEA